MRPSGSHPLIYKPNNIQAPTPLNLASEGTYFSSGSVITVLARKIDRTQECFGCSSGGMTTKIHATCDALGNLTGFYSSLVHVHHAEGVDVLLEALLDQI